MDRPRARLAAIALLSAACAPAFDKARTPSGEPCADLPIIPAGTEPSRPYHRIAPIISDEGLKSEAERLESLRREACRRHADAVIEAVNEEQPGGGAPRSSGTAVVWKASAGPSDGGAATPR